jgi:hypothetical protein
MKFIQKYWLPVVLVIAIAAALVSNTTKKETINTENSIDDQIQTLTKNPIAQCYLYEKGVNSETREGIYEGFNREYIEISITDAGLATGQHLILPFEADSNRANFLGISMDGYINVAATAIAKGKTWQEQRLYKIVGDKLFVGYQEIFVPRYDNENGLYLFEDINKLSFETEEFFLSKVECSSIDKSQF